MHAVAAPVGRAEGGGAYALLKAILFFWWRVFADRPPPPVSTCSGFATDMILDKMYVVKYNVV